MSAHISAFPAPAAVAGAVTARLDRARRLPSVTQLELFLTEECCLRCDYCWVGKGLGRRMSPDVARESLDFLSRAAGSARDLSVTLFGGEPLLCWELMHSIVQYAQVVSERTGKRFRFNITTNGMLFDDRWGLFCRGSGIKYLLSIDGCREEHDRHRRDGAGAGTYDAVVARIPTMAKYQPWMGARMTVHPDGVHRLLDGVLQLQKLGIKQFLISPATGQPWPQRALCEWVEQMTKVGRHHLDMRARGVPFRVTRFEEHALRKGAAAGVFGCRAGRNSMSVAPDGTLHGCSKLIPFDGAPGEWALGDVWRGATNVQTRLLLTDTTSDMRPQCRTCSFSDECTGGCPADNYADTGCVFTPSEATCALSAAGVEIRDRFIAISHGVPS